MKKIVALLVAVCAAVLPLGVDAATPAETLVYAKRDTGDLRLDLYVPGHAADKPFPVIVWVHGGAWRKGSRASVPIQSLTERGFAIASVDYRLSPAAKFPAQVIDIREAIEFLAANSAELNLAQDRLAIAGASAGGHLAALVAVSTDKTFGETDKLKAEIKAAVSFYGASNLASILRQSTPHGLSVRVPALDLLLGAQPEVVPDVAKEASPVFHVDSSDPPLLLLHGDQDPQMPINQAHELQGRYQEAGLTVEFDVLHGAAHGGREFYTSKALGRVADFLQQHLN